MKLQGDSLGGDSELSNINRAVIYRRRPNLTSTCLGGCEDNYVAEDVEIDSLRLETQADPPRSRALQQERWQQLRKRRESSRQVSVYVVYTMLPRFIFVGKLFRGL